MFLFWSIMHRVITTVFKKYDPIMQWTFYWPIVKISLKLPACPFEKTVSYYIVFGGDLV